MRMRKYPFQKSLQAAVATFGYWAASTVFIAATAPKKAMWTRCGKGGGYTQLLLTDPPYNVDYEGGTEEKMRIANDNLSDCAFERLLTESFENAKERLKPGGAFYIFHPDSNGLVFRKTCEAVGLHVRQCIIWVKNAFVMG